MRATGAPSKAAAMVVDGSVLEGGGQILRMATALAAIRQAPLTVTNIREGRKQPGLRPQHLTGLQLIAEMCSAATSGLAVGSTQISLQPNQLPAISDRPIIADTKTAGSCTLLAQVAIPCALYSQPGPTGGAALHLHLRGGTDAAFAPPVGYLQHVLLPLLRHLQGDRISLDLHRRGFNPLGGGLVELRVTPLPPGESLPPFCLTSRGKMRTVTILSYSGGSEVKATAELMAFAAAERLRKELPDVDVVTRIEHDADAKGSGCGIMLTAAFESGCLLSSNALGGGKRQSSESTGRKAAEVLLAELAHGGCVDRWAQDQLVVYMALAAGRSAFTCGQLRMHTVTAIRIAEQLTAAAFTVKGPDGSVRRGIDIEETPTHDDDDAAPPGYAAAGRCWTVSCDSPGIPHPC